MENRGGRVGPLWCGLDMDIHMVVKRGGQAPCLKCPQSPTHIPGEDPAQGPDSPGRSQGVSISHGHRWRARLCPGGRKCTHTPRQKIKCSLAGWTWGLVLSCPPNPEAWSQLAKTLPLAVPGSWAFMDGAPWPTKPEAPWIFPWPIWPALTTRPLRSTPWPHLQWAWARWRAQGLAEQLAGSGMGGGGGGAAVMDAPGRGVWRSLSHKRRLT